MNFNKIKRIFLIICCLIVICFSILINFIRQQYIVGFIKLAIGIVLLIIYSDKNLPNDSKKAIVKE